MRKRLLVAAILAVLAFSGSVGAQSQVHFSSVLVDIWPEYDKPATLVIYHIQAAPEMPLPLQVTLRVPAGASLNAVADLDSAGNTVNAAYERRVEGIWAILNITADTRQLQVEYYDPLNKNGAARHVVYQWAGDADVDSFTVEFLEPVGAKNLVLVPPAATSSTNQYTLVLYQTAPVKLAAGEAYTLTADYQKSNDDLTASVLPVQPPAPLSQNTLGNLFASGVMRVFGWTLGGLVVAGLLAGFFIWLGYRRSPAEQRRRAQAGDRGKTSVDEVYCSQCGTRAQAGDAFCRFCGARLRMPS